jgi:benzoyl-CoA reductase/2-hydroxyglutaryl-CoA dehydratase subunit BcrC/BadD/HgdB
MVYIYESIPELIETYIEYLQTEKAQGKKLIGFFAHEFVPYELLSALDIVPVPLIWAGEESRVSTGGDYLTPTMCPFALSQIGAFHQKEEKNCCRFLSLVDGILATNYCAADMFVNEWVRDLNHLAWFTLHIPFLQEPHHIQFYKTELIRLTKALEEFSGNTLDLNKLQKEIIKRSKMKEVLQRILSSSLLGSQKNKLIQQFHLFGLQGLADWNLDELIAFEKTISLEKHSKSHKILLAGASVFIGDDLYEFIEECGGNVVYDATWLGLSSISPNSRVNLSNMNSCSLDSLFDYLTDYFAVNNVSLRCAPNSSTNYVDLIKKSAQKYDVNAIIYHIIKFCDITGHHRTHIKDLISKSGLQCLTLERDYSASMSGQIRTRIEAFFEML